VLLDQFIFFPDAAVPPPPGRVEERWIATGDRVRLHAWYAEAAAPAATLIWSHGNGGNIAGRAEVLLALRDRDLNVLAYDYRGYGRSTGRPSEAGVYRDACAAYDSERARGVAPERIVAFGESLGGAVSIQLACERPCAGVAVVSTFTTLADVARCHYGAIAALARGRFESMTRVPRLRVPIFVAHGDLDEIVPFALGEMLYGAAPEPKRFFRAAGAHHNDVFASPGLLDAIAAFARFAVAEASG
jgi:fermentation-respiration switch protein FrsA (DUF1100 family)